MMEKWLEKRLGTDTNDLHVRSRWGKVTSIIGIAANILLFAGKLAVGWISGSVSIAADAVNNLSDASSSVVSLLGFKFSEKPADKEHPYGHGRFEYLAGLLVAVMIMVIGGELFVSSVKKILLPASVSLSIPIVLVLLGSILVKGWLCQFNHRLGQKIGSKMLEAAAIDSRNDAIATGAVLLSMMIGHYTGMMLDGWMGAAVALFILIGGFGLIKNTVDPMIGALPSKDLVSAVRRTLLSYPGVLGIHDLMIHDYGPGRQYASVHLEMDAGYAPLAAHELIDRIERDLLLNNGLHVVIHHDPVAVDDPRVAVMKEIVSSIVSRIDSRIAIHDLRIVPGDEHTNVVFDCVLPYDLEADEEEIREMICREVSSDYPDYRCMITMEHSFV